MILTETSNLLNIKIKIKYFFSELQEENKHDLNLNYS